jgi:hypothetical protein
MSERKHYFLLAVLPSGIPSVRLDDKLAGKLSVRHVVFHAVCLADLLSVLQSCSPARWLVVLPDCRQA